MNTEEIAHIVSGQRAYFKTHATFDVDARRRALMRLRDAVRAHEDDIAHALKTDLGKSHDEAYMCEIGTSLSEIRHQIAHVARWSRSPARSLRATRWSSSRAPMRRLRVRCSGRFARKRLIRVW